MVEKGDKMTTIKVTVEAAAVVANTVRRLKAQGEKGMTADKLIRRLMETQYPEDARLILGEQSGGLAQQSNSEAE